MARKRLMPRGEEGRKTLKNVGAPIDDRYNNALKGMVEKQKRDWGKKK